MQPASINGLYRIDLRSYDDSALATVSNRESKYTVRQLELGRNYSIRIRVELQFTGFYGGNCYSSRRLYGEYTDPIYAETQESGIIITLCILFNILRSDN